ncbi:hypothetical protein R1flu_011430 [Riccia fluitans]|uniref:Reverse transcriptase RNase H-like domain-containing protein n=1 Tax=Riccia fluitans TaxID=41844 RepID=A0ABD1Z7S9_9MARC
MKAEKEYLTVVVENDCLPLLRMITNCSTPDMTMLNWIAYIKSLNPKFKHITGKENVVVDMLSRARYEGEEDMVEDVNDVGEEFFSISHLRKDSEDAFRQNLYDGEWLEIGRYLSMLNRQEGWMDGEFRRVRRKAYNYILKDG